jgi:hypothetical protein
MLGYVWGTVGTVRTQRLRVKLMFSLIWAKSFYTRIWDVSVEAPVYKEMAVAI